MLSADTLQVLTSGVTNITWQGVVMILAGLFLLYLAIVKEYEPLLLVPISIGCILANLPLSPMIAEGGLLVRLYGFGINGELFPLLIFIGIGALTDFGPLLENPRLVLLGGAGQFGIFLTLLLALILGFTRPEAASIGIIGAIDGPTSIYVSSILAPHLLGPITVAAYSYMSLVPIIMPPVIKLLTTQRERRIRMPYTKRDISHRIRVMFPIGSTIFVGILIPYALPLVGAFMLGNLLKESKVVDRLASMASNELANIVTLFLGLAIGSTMAGETFLNYQTVYILILGLAAFALDAAAGVLFAKLLNVIGGGNSLNPMIGAAGISAFPMAARVVQKMAADEDFENFILMHAMGANGAGQLASAVAGGVMVALMIQYAV
jgi:oxaloacetate decarboxylase beta subunit